MNNLPSRLSLAREAKRRPTITIAINPPETSTKSPIRSPKERKVQEETHLDAFASIGPLLHSPKKVEVLESYLVFPRQVYTSPIPAKSTTAPDANSKGLRKKILSTPKLGMPSNPQDKLTPREKLLANQRLTKPDPLDEYLLGFGMMRVKAPKDGNCCYHSVNINKRLRGEPMIPTDEMRLSVHDEIVENFERYKIPYDDICDFLDQVKDRGYAGPNEVLALAHVYDRPIKVFNFPLGKESYIYGGELKGGDTFNLVFSSINGSNWGHFDAVIRIDPLMPTLKSDARELNGTRSLKIPVLEAMDIDEAICTPPNDKFSSLDVDTPTPKRLESSLEDDQVMMSFAPEQIAVLDHVEGGGPVFLDGYVNSLLAKIDEQAKTIDTQAKEIEILKSQLKDKDDDNEDKDGLLRQLDRSMSRMNLNRDLSVPYVPVENDVKDQCLFLGADKKLDLKSLNSAGTVFSYFLAERKVNGKVERTVKMTSLEGGKTQIIKSRDDLRARMSRSIKFLQDGHSLFENPLNICKAAHGPEKWGDPIELNFFVEEYSLAQHFKEMLRIILHCNDTMMSLTNILYFYTKMEWIGKGLESTELPEGINLLVKKSNFGRDIFEDYFAREGIEIVKVDDEIKLIKEKDNTPGTVKKSVRKVYNPKERTIECDTCGKKYASRKDFLNHRLNVHKIRVRNVYIPKERTIECDICGKKYPSQKNLLTHRLNVHKIRVRKVYTPEERTFECDTCGKKYPSQKHLLDHRRNIHKIRRIYNLKKKCTEPEVTKE